MPDIEFYVIQPEDTEIIKLISEWYLKEWNVPIEKTIHKLRTITSDSSQLHVLMKVDDVAIATGGLHQHVGLLDKVLEFAIHKNWLAMVYTLPE